MRTKRTELEDELAIQYKLARLPEPEREYCAIPGRKYRWDFAFVGQKVLVEVQGGIWIKGGHSTGTGILRDCEKLCLAESNGWHCLSVVKEQIKSGEALLWTQKTLALYGSSK